MIKTGEQEIMSELRRSKERDAFINKYNHEIMKVVRSILEQKTQHCVNCIHWAENEEMCKMFKARPPAYVIVTGCPQHMHNDDIPF